MEVSAKWWGLLSDYVRSIKKSIAVATQLALDESQAISIAQGVSANPSLPKPLQPSNTRPSPALPSRKNQSPTQSPKLPPRNRPSPKKVTSTSYGSTTSLESPISTSLEPVSLPPRRTPANQTHSLHSRSNIQSSFSQDKPSLTPALKELVPEPVPSPFQNTSDVPVALQMEMALQAAVDDRKRSTTPKSSNPWGDDEVGGNIWS